MKALQDLWKQIEVRFWHRIAIPLLDTNSEAVKSIVSVGYHSMKRYQPMNNFYKAFMWVFMGLSFGLAIGLLFY